MQAEIYGKKLFLVGLTNLELEKVQIFLRHVQKSQETDMPVVLGMLDMSSVTPEGEFPWMGLYLEACSHED